MLLLNTAMRVAAACGNVKLGSVHFIADPHSARAITEDTTAAFGRCPGTLGMIDLADADQLSPLSVVDDRYTVLVNDEVRTMLRSICLTCSGGTRDDAFDANVVGRDAAGHLMMRTIMAPAIFDVGAMHATVDAVLDAATRRHFASILPTWCQPADDLEQAFEKFRSMISTLECPTSIPATLNADERARAFLALWAHGASSLSASIAWMLCDWTRRNRDLSADGFTESVLRSHPQTLWIARRALRRTFIPTTPSSDGCVMTYPYDEICEGDIVIILPPAVHKRCDKLALPTTNMLCHATMSLPTLMLRTLALSLCEQHVNLTPDTNASFEPTSCSVVRPRRPLLVPRYIQA